MQFIAYPTWNLLRTFPLLKLYTSIYPAWPDIALVKKRVFPEPGQREKEITGLKPNCFTSTSPEILLNCIPPSEPELPTHASLLN